MIARHGRRRSVVLQGLFAALVALVALVVASCAAPLEPTLDLAPERSDLVTGEVAQLTATRHFPGGAIEDVSARVTYTTSDKGVATVDDKGVVTAHEPGTALVRAYDPTTSATGVATFTVTAPSVESIDVSPSPAFVMTRGDTHPFTATARMSDGTQRDVTEQVLWSSTNEAAASVGDTPGANKGVVTAVAPGDTTILATDAVTHVQGRTTVFVTGEAPQLVAIVVTPNPGLVAIGKTTPFSALGVLSDGSSKDVTNEVTWSSSRPDVATVASGGVVTGVAAGDTTITATGPEPSTGVRGSAAARVSP